MRLPPDHPLVADPALARWAAHVDAVVPGASEVRLLRYLPGRRVATLVERAGEPAVVKVFASPRARGNARRLAVLARTDAAPLVPEVLGCDPAGHVLALSYRAGLQPADVPHGEYAGHFASIGHALRRLHDCGAELDRAWEWTSEVDQLRRHAVPATRPLVEELTTSTRRLPPADLVPSHRDFHPLQVVLGVDGSVAFIDLDDAAMAPRGLDLGNMLGHLVREPLIGQRTAHDASAAARALLAGYGPCPGLDDGVLGGWTALTVARLAGLAQSRHGDTAQRDALLEHARADPARLRDAPAPG